MRKAWRSTFGLVALVGCLFAIATLIVGLLAARLTHEAMEDQLNHRIDVEVHALIDEGDYGPTGIAAAVRRRDAARSTASLDYLLLDTAGRRLAGSLELRSPVRRGYYEFLQYRRGAESRIGQSFTMTPPGGGTLIVAADRGVIDAMDAALRLLFLIAFGVLLLLGIGAAWLVGAVTRSRLARIDRTALAIIEGDLTRRVPLAGSGDEIDRVSATLNRMLDRIGGLMTNLRQVSSDIAHDLRTPLTRLHNRLEEASKSDDPIIRSDAIAAASNQSRELLDIFASLLRIAEIEGMPARTHFRTVAWSALVEELLETYQPDLEARGHDLRAVIARDVSVMGDRRLLQQALTNLLDNILRHTPAGTPIRVSLERDGAIARLTVADEGPGVDPEDRPRLFQRFARAERSRSTEGHGLGLALVAAVAHAHRGTATLTDPPGFGVIIAIPLTH